jgi:hypothetical protein
VLFMAATNILMAAVEHGSMGGTAYAAHIGGMLAGWLYLRTPNAQSLDRLRRRIAPAPDYGDEPPRPVPKSSSRPRDRDVDEIVAQSKAAVARVRPAPQPSATTATITPVPATAFDAVLDKIAAQGMGALTSAEKLLLEEWSKKLRGH